MNPTRIIRYRLSDPLTFTHKDGTPAREPAVARLSVEGPDCGTDRDSSPGFSGARLVLTAELTDSDIYNTAERNNVKTWLTGDVLEFFFQPPDRTDYYELHVTPTNKTLQLHMANVRAAFDVPFENKICETGFRYLAQVEPDRWTVRMEIPLSRLNCQTAYGARFLVCRQNYSRAWDQPDITVTSPLTGSVHSPDEWPRIELP